MGIPVFTYIKYKLHCSLSKVSVVQDASDSLQGTTNKPWLILSIELYIDALKVD